MVSACAIGSQQHEDQVAGPVINGFKVNALRETQEAADGRCQAGKARMRDGHAFADACGAKPFAFHHGIFDGAGRIAGRFCQGVTQDVDRLFAACGFMKGNNNPAL
jgi:hypothetical protein